MLQNAQMNRCSKAVWPSVIVEQLVELNRRSVEEHPADLFVIYNVVLHNFISVAYKEKKMINFCAELSKVLGQWLVQL